MKNKSLAKNAFLNVLKTMLSMIFPLITFPYVSRVLQVENIGKVNFSLSIVNYFLLLAGLGVKTYAIREGARYRDNKEKLDQFASQVFSINVISTIIAYTLLFGLTVSMKGLESYKTLIYIQSINIIGTTLGVEWIFTIYEDYLYVTLRSLAVQVCSLILLFLCVHSSDDYLIYAFISVFSMTASNIFGFVYSRKLVKIKLTQRMNLRKNMPPIFVIFAMAVATTIYVNSDTTMLGLMSGDYYVGIYNTATKMYTILKSLMSACILVTLPRLSNYVATGNVIDFRIELKRIMNSFLLILFPTIIGTVMTSKEIIMILAGKEFMDAAVSLQILSIGLFFSVFAIYLTNAVLLPRKLEKHIMYATIVSAVINISLNFILIPLMNHNGAAITTVISEFTVCIWQFAVVRKELKGIANIRNIVICLFGCAAIVGVCMSVNFITEDVFIRMIIKVAFSVLVYCIFVLGLKHETAIEIKNTIFGKLKLRN